MSGEGKALDRVLSQAGLCSRTQAEERIRAGRVAVDGAVERDPARRLDPGACRIEVDGVALAPAKRIYLALHKPVGYVTTRDDPDGRATVYDLLGDLGEWVAPVGRLDLETSGLLLLSNDTAWAHGVASPGGNVPKTYRVKAKGGLTEEKLAELRAGVDLKDGGGKTRPAEVAVESATAKRTWLVITIAEGRNRQVRKMLRAVGSKVQALERISVGPVKLEGLESGKWRPLTPEEVASLSQPSGASK